MRVSYSSVCPTCKVEGKTNRLFRDLSEPGEVRCALDHVFTGEEARALVELSDDVPAAPPTVKPAGEPVLQMTPLPSSVPEEALVPTGEAPSGNVHQMPAAVEVTTSNRIIRAGEPLEIEIVDSPPSKKFHEPKELPGDALEITVVIPDPHASYLRGEAQFRGKSVQEFFEEMMLYGMDNRWWY